MSKRAVPLACLLVFATAGMLPAQDADSTRAGETGTTADRSWSTELWAGYGNNSTLQISLGDIAGVDVAFTSIGFSRHLAGGSRFELRQTVELLPAVFVSSLSWDRVETDCPTGKHCRLPSGFGSTGAVYGFGLSPVGLETRWALASAAHIFAGARGGATWFGREVPLEGGGRLHYFAGLGAGVRVRLGRAGWLRVGYEAHHLSNANTAPENPGMDWHIWNVGLSRTSP